MPQVARVGDVDSDGDTIITGSSTVYAGNASFSPEFVTPKISLPQVYDIEFVRANIQEVGRSAEFDDKESIDLIPSTYPEDVPPVTYDGNIKDEVRMSDSPKDTPELGDCRVIELPLNYNIRISEHYTIANLSTAALFRHQIKAQVGLSEQDIVCNMEGLAKNIMEPIREKYGRFRINSGFRVGSGRSQHNRGMAVDIQEPTWGNKKHLEVAEWIAQHLPFDQLILEHGRSVWIHVSFDRTKNKQRGQIMTMVNNKFSSGLKLYYS